MNLKKHGVLTIAAILTLALFTGCTGSAGSSSKPSEDNPTDVSSPEGGTTTNSDPASEVDPEEASDSTTDHTSDSESEQPAVTDDASSQEEPAEWTLVWSDEFDGDSIDTNTWNYELGYIRNNELQYYTNRPENARIEDGNLVIEALKEDYSGYAYTSASLNTRHRQSFQYGKIEMRAKLPYGQGIWPAFWTMGDSGGWPGCGEIDILEMIGGGSGRDNKMYGTIHWDNNGHQSKGGNTTLKMGIFADDYHTFGIEWDAEQIRWYLDGEQFFQADITKDDMSEFHQKHWILLNLAIGGNWPGSPNDSTEFPQKYYIDWVRVYQR